MTGLSAAAIHTSSQHSTPAYTLYLQDQTCRFVTTTATVNHHVLPPPVLQLYGSSSGAVQASVQPSAAGEAQAGTGAQQDT